MCLYPQHTIRV